MPRKAHEGILIKICGLTTLEDAAAALDLGADFLGFVLYGGSPRCVSGFRLRRIREKLPEGARVVGVFVDAARAEILEIATTCGLDAVQLHGNEDPVEFRDMPLPVWRAVSFQGGKPSPRPDAWAADRYLVDSALERKLRGAGGVADWTSAAAFCRARPSFLAGGLDENNVQAAIRAVRPIGVDVAGGVETRPGKKDLKKMESFIRNAKNVPPDAEENQS